MSVMSQSTTRIPVAEVDHGSETATAVARPSAIGASRTRLAGVTDNALIMMRDRLSASPLRGACRGSESAALERERPPQYHVLATAGPHAVTLRSEKGKQIGIPYGTSVLNQDQARPKPLRGIAEERG
jgi:hypothetical protein